MVDDAPRPKKKKNKENLNVLKPKWVLQLLHAVQLLGTGEPWSCFPFCSLPGGRALRSLCVDSSKGLRGQSITESEEERREGSLLQENEQVIKRKLHEVLIWGFTSTSDF